MKICSYGESSLHLAARCGSVATVKVLLEHGIDWTAEGQDGTALKVAEQMNHSRVVKVLEEWAADSSKGTNKGRKARLTFSNVNAVVDSIFEFAYASALIPQ